MSGTVSRPPVGMRAQARSLSALSAHIASKMAGIGSGRGERDSWLRDHLGLRLRANGLDRASRLAGEAVHPWLLVDEFKLPLYLDKALVVFPGGGRDRRSLIEALRSTGMVRQIMVGRSRRDVFAVFVFERVARDALFRELDSLGEPFLWDELLEEDRRVELAAWIHLTKRLARDEGLGD